MAYLHHYYELNSTVERTRMQQRAQSYQIVNIELYKISVSDRLLHCFSKTKGQQILSEVHTRVCGGHIGAEALAAKTLQQGFYWLGMIDDAVKLVSTCEACQRFSRKMKAPIQPVQLITPSWPLERWGINIVGKLTPAQGNYTFTVVVVEYFTKYRSEATHQREPRVNKKILLAKHHLSLWGTQTHNSRQRKVL
jgi:hypothetical protein